MKKNVKYILLLAGCLLILYLGFGFYNEIEVTYYNIDADQINNPIKIALVTDLHSCDYGMDAQELVSLIDEASPDLILLGGDIVDDLIPRDNAEAFFEAVADTYPCYYISGNHEYWSDDIDGIKSLISSYDITILEGDSVIIPFGDETIRLSGIDDPEIDDYKRGKSLFMNQLQDVKQYDDDTYHILLTHRPYISNLDFSDYFDDPVFDLVLSGHAHGGQWQFPPFNKGVFSPEQGIFPEYTGGLYTFYHTQMILSRGLAKESTKVFRFYNRPELPIITIE